MRVGHEERQQLVWNEHICEVVAERGKVVDRVLHGNASFSEGLGEGIQQLGKEDVLIASFDEASSGLHGEAP
jgi:hypothetical protein